MAIEKELKPKSFRIDDETADKFKGIAASIGGNQQETLAKLIEAYEFQSGKAILTDKKADIESFEKYATALTRMYMSSLEDNQNITETVKTQFDALLKSKDATIQDLQEKLTVAKQLKEEATLKSKALVDENNDYSNRILSLNNLLEDTKDNYESILKDKNSLNKALLDSCNELKSKVELISKENNELKMKLQSFDKIENEYNQLLTDNKQLKYELEESIKRSTMALDQATQKEQNTITNLKQNLEIEKEKAILTLERKYQEQIMQLKEDKQKEIDKYQQKYFDLLEHINANNSINDI